MQPHQEEITTYQLRRTQVNDYRVTTNLMSTSYSLRSNERARSYGDQVKGVANTLDVAVVNTWTLLEGESRDKSKYLSDGLHLNEHGNRKVYEGIIAALTDRYSHVLWRRTAMGVLAHLNFHWRKTHGNKLSRVYEEVSLDLLSLCRICHQHP